MLLVLFLADCVVLSAEFEVSLDIVLDADVLVEVSLGLALDRDILPEVDNDVGVLPNIDGFPNVDV